MLLPVVPLRAAVPAFQLDADVRGRTVHVTVTFQPVPQGFAWGSLEASGVFGELVGLVPADLVGADGRPRTQATPVLLSLQRSGEGVYEGAAEVTEGRWAVVAWPVEPAFDPAQSYGAPGTDFVTVGGPSPWVWLAIGGVAGLVIAAMSLLMAGTTEPEAGRG